MEIIEFIKLGLQNLSSDKELPFWLTQRKNEKGIVGKIAYQLDTLVREKDLSFQIILEKKVKTSDKNNSIDIAIKNREKYSYLEFKYTNLEKHYKLFTSKLNPKKKILREIEKDIIKLNTLKRENNDNCNHFVIPFFFLYNTDQKIMNHYHYAEDHNKLIDLDISIQTIIDILKKGLSTYYPQFFTSDHLVQITTSTYKNFNFRIIFSPLILNP